MQQTTVLRYAQRSFSLREWTNVKRNEFAKWLNSESEIFTLLCGERFTHREVLLMHLYLIVMLAACGVAEWLEGGAL